MDKVLFWILGIFALAGALDRIFGNSLGLGGEFENGLLTMGSLMLAMAGIVSLSPILAAGLRPVILPVFRFLGADPAMFAGSILACDMGGGALARQLTGDIRAANLGGVITGSMLGATLVFTIPVALGILEPEDRPYFAKGILCGMVTIPIGIFTGGLTAGYPMGMVLRNLIPIVILSGLIALGLWKAERAMVRGFTLFGQFVVVLATLGLGAAIFQNLTGVNFLPGLAPIEEGIGTVGTIAVVLAGAFPMVYLLTRLLKGPLTAAGRLIGINDAAAAGLVAALANSIAAFTMVKDKNPRGKVVTIAFCVSGAFVLGDHLGFAAGFAPEILPAMLAGKLAGGIAAAILALILTKKD